MLYLSLDELRLVVRNRNIRDYENKSIKVLSKPKPKIKINKKKLQELRKDFSEVRNKFSKNEIDKYRKTFYDIKNYRHLSASEIKKAGKNLTKLKISLTFKKFHGNVYSVDFDDLDNYDYNYDFADDDECRKIGSVRTLFNEFDGDYRFDGRENNYIEYTGRGDRYENLSPKKYLNMIGPYLWDLINDHKPTEELDKNGNNNANNSHTIRGEWKIQLMVQNNSISTKNFENTSTIYSACKPVNVFMVNDTKYVIDRLFDTLLQRFQKAIETPNESGSEFTHESVALLHYYF